MMEPVNVREPWEIHDTLCVCSTLYGSESSAGYFATFAAFGQQLEHLFFKRRSEGNVHRAYNNQQAEDRADFVFHAFQVGLAFIAPPTPLDIDGAAPANPKPGWYPVRSPPPLFSLAQDRTGYQPGIECHDDVTRIWSCELGCLVWGG